MRDGAWYVILWTDSVILLEVEDIIHKEPPIKSYDEIVLRTLADDALPLLGKNDRYREGSHMNAEMVASMRLVSNTIPVECGT